MLVLFSPHKLHLYFVNKRKIMKKTTIYGIALILGTLGFIVTMIFHPTGADIMNNNENSFHGIQVAIYTHGLAIGSIPVAFLGFWGLSRLLGTERISVQLALIFYGFGCIAAMCAAVCSGFGATSLAKLVLKTDSESAKQILLVVYQYNGFMNQGFAKVFVVTLSIAIILWSYNLWQKNLIGKIIGTLGGLFSLFYLIIFFTGTVRLDVAGFGLIIFVHAVWSILLSIWIIKWNSESETVNLQA